MSTVVITVAILLTATKANSDCRRIVEQIMAGTEIAVPMDVCISNTNIGGGNFSYSYCYTCDGIVGKYFLYSQANCQGTATEAPLTSFSPQADAYCLKPACDYVIITTLTDTCQSSQSAYVADYCQIPLPSGGGVCPNGCSSKYTCTEDAAQVATYAGVDCGSFLGISERDTTTVCGGVKETYECGTASFECGKQTPAPTYDPTQSPTSLTTQNPTYEPTQNPTWKNQLQASSMNRNCLSEMVSLLLIIISGYLCL